MKYLLFIKNAYCVEEIIEISPNNNELMRWEGKIGQRQIE